MSMRFTGRVHAAGKRYKIRWTDKNGKERLYAQAATKQEAAAHLRRGQTEHQDDPQVAASFEMVDSLPEDSDTKNVS